MTSPHPLAHGHAIVSIGSKSLPVDHALCQEAGPFAAVLKRIGFEWADVRAAGFDLPSLKAAGYDAAAFRAAVCDWADMRTAGFTLAEAKAAGCDLASAKSAGYDVLCLVEAFGLNAVAASGCDVSVVSYVLVSGAHARARALELIRPRPPSPPLSATAPTFT